MDSKLRVFTSSSCGKRVCCRRSLSAEERLTAPHHLASAHTGKVFNWTNTPRLHRASSSGRRSRASETPDNAAACRHAHFNHYQAHKGFHGIRANG